MNASEKLEALRKDALEKFKTVTPRNPPIIGIHCERWPMMERCHPTTRHAEQAMRNSDE